MEKWNNKNSDSLFKAVLALRNSGEAKRFFRDLLTEKEIIEFGNRWLAARMLYMNIPYKKIEVETGLSTRTIARISKWLNFGKGGYKLMLKRLNHHNSLTFEKG